MIFLLAVILSLIGCASDYRNGNPTLEHFEKERAKFVEQQCQGSSMVGENSGVNLIFSAKYDELKSASANLSVQRYRELSQKLEGYRVEWELTHQELNRTCKTYASCRFTWREGNSKCEGARADVTATRNRMLDFVTKLTELQIVK